MTPVEVHADFQVEGLVWVATIGDRLIGFATCQAFDDGLHLAELAVAYEQQGRGAGRALIAAVADEARRRSLPAVTLTTFRDIGWNGPLYARLGFVELRGSEIPPRLAALLAAEAERGLDAPSRCAMRLALA